MATLAQMQTDLASCEAALRALYSGANFSATDGSGGGIRVDIDKQADLLRKEISRLKLSIAVASGNMTGTSLDRQGIDVDRTSKNGDWP